MPVKGGHRHVDQARISSGHARINSSFLGPGFSGISSPAARENAVTPEPCMDWSRTVRRVIRDENHANAATLVSLR